MAAQLDHLIVPTRDRRASARLIGTLLGVPWAEQAAIGPFSPVYVNDGLTLDFDEWPEPVPKQHYAFRVSPAEFDAILGRLQAAGLAYRSQPLGPDDHQVNAAFGGKLLYWSEPDGHAWEILTVSYARAMNTATPTHPVDAWHAIARAQDVAGLDTWLAEDAVFVSPVVHTPQRGKAITRAYLAAAFQVFFNPSFRYVREVRGPSDAMLEFKTEIDGVAVNGVDILRWNAEGRIVEFKVMIRPLKAIQKVHEQMARMLAAARPGA